MPDFKTLFGASIRASGEVYAQGSLNVRDWNNLINRPPVARTDDANTFTGNQSAPGVLLGESGSNNARVSSRAGSGYDYAHRHRNIGATRDWGWLVDSAGGWSLVDITAGPLTRLAINTAGGVGIGGATPGSAAGDLTQPLGTTHRWGNRDVLRATSGSVGLGYHSAQPFFGLAIDLAANPPTHGTVIDVQHSDGNVVTMRRIMTTVPGGAVPAGARVLYLAQ